MNFKFLFFLLLVAISATAQERSVYGKVINQATGKPLESVNVTNLRNKQIGVTNSRGEFYLRALPADSILITSIGYKRVGIAWDGKTKEPVIALNQDAILLEEVVIKQQRIELLQQQIDELLNNPENAESLRKETVSNLLNTNVSTPGGGIGISIDALYDLYSKEGKSRRKAADLEYKDKLKYYADIRFNKNMVAQITKLPEEDLDEFMKYCRFTNEYVLQATNYELTYEILENKKRFVNNRIFRHTD